MKNPAPYGEKKSLLAALISAAAILLFVFFPLPKNWLASPESSVRIYDRDDNLLMELTPDKSGFSDPVSLDEVPASFTALLLFSEDRRFYKHHGVSLLSVVRASYQNLHAHRIVSGGSTIDQQLARLRLPPFRSAFLRKLAEMRLALRIDLYFPKRTVLEAYCNQVYLGNRIYGFAKAARVYFDKDLSQLTLLESAALILSIRSPQKYDLYRNTQEVEDKAKTLLKLYYRAGKLSTERYALETEDHLRIRPFETDTLAPHFCLWVYEQAKKLVPRRYRISEVHTTLDGKLYRAALDVVRDRMTRLQARNVDQASLLMIDNRSMEILVMLGSRDFFGDLGQINGVFIERQPGSTMKAFNYALALESGRFTPATVLPDLYLEFPSPVGKYIPDNYDERYHGPVRLAMALGCSYNIPAVYVENQMGLYRYYKLLRDAGFDSLDRPARYYGLGLTLGAADCTLYELTRAYTIFPNGGLLREPRAIFYVMTTEGKAFMPPGEPSPRRIVSRETAFLISHILSEFKYKTPAFGANSPIDFPFPIAVKTGTSKDFRDNTVEAWTTDWTLGIWTGNFSGEPMRNTPSAAGGAIFLRDLVEWMHNNGYPTGQAFDYSNLDITMEKVCALSGMKAGPYCTDTVIEFFLRGTEPDKECTWHTPDGTMFPDLYRRWAESNLPGMEPTFVIGEGLQIESPREGDVYRLDPTIPLQSQQIRFEAIGCGEGVKWYVNGREAGEGRRTYWQLAEGNWRIEARDNGTNASVNITVVR